MSNNSNTEGIKTFPKFLVDSGLVFEINRKVLHPLGLSIIVDVDRNNRKQLSIIGIQTEDEEGFVYDSESFLHGVEKYNKFLEKSGSEEKLLARKEKYGFIEQDKEV
jgi:hypothetical protein